MPSTVHEMSPKEVLKRVGEPGASGEKMAQTAKAIAETAGSLFGEVAIEPRRFPPNTDAIALFVIQEVRARFLGIIPTTKKRVLVVLQDRSWWASQEIGCTILEPKLLEISNNLVKKLANDLNVSPAIVNGPEPLWI